MCEDVFAQNEIEPKCFASTTLEKTMTLAHAHMALLFVLLQRCTIDFTYFMAMQVYISFFGLAAVAALGEETSDASLEHTAASKGVMPGSASNAANTISSATSDASLEHTAVSKKMMPGSASSAANTISSACGSHVSLEKVVDPIDLQKVARGFPCGVSNVKPVKARCYMAMVVVAIGIFFLPVSAIRSSCVHCEFIA